MFIGFALALWVTTILPTILFVILERRYRAAWSATLEAHHGPYRSSAPIGEGGPHTAPRSTKQAAWACLYFAQGLLLPAPALVLIFVLFAFRIETDAERLSALGLILGAGTVGLAAYGLTLRAGILLLRARPTEARSAVAWTAAWALLLCVATVWTAYDKVGWGMAPDSEFLGFLLLTLVHCALPRVLRRGIRAAEEQLYGADPAPSTPPIEVSGEARAA